MSDMLRSRVIRLAATLPTDSDTRKALLDVLAHDKSAGARPLLDVVQTVADRHFGKRGWDGEFRKDTYAMKLPGGPYWRGGYFADSMADVLRHASGDVKQFLLALDKEIKNWVAQHPDEDGGLNKLAFSFTDDSGNDQAWTIQIWEVYPSPT